MRNKWGIDFHMHAADMTEHMYVTTYCNILVTVPYKVIDSPESSYHQIECKTWNLKSKI